MEKIPSKEEKESRPSINPLSFLTSSGDSLEAYLAAVKNTQMLSREEEYEMGVKSFSQGDKDAIEGLVLGNLRFVIHIARSYMGYGLPLQELIQEGNVGLIQAARRFDPHRGVRFISFAVYWIKAEIHEYILRNWRIVKIATTKPQRKLFFNLRRNKKSLSWLTEEEIASIAKDLNVKPVEVREMEGRLMGGDVPFDVDETDDDETSTAPSEYLADDSMNPELLAETETRQQKLQGALIKAIKYLDSRSLDIIQRRWLNNKKVTRGQLAKEYKVSVERIRQIEESAFVSLRKNLSKFEDF